MLMYEIEGFIMTDFSFSFYLFSILPTSEVEGKGKKKIAAIFLLSSTQFLSKRAKCSFKNCGLGYVAKT